MRTKIIAGNLLTVLVVGLMSYALVRSSLEAALVFDVDSRIVRDFELVSRSLALGGRELESLVEQQAAARFVHDVFGALDENSRRQRAFEASQRISTWLGDPARGRRGRPDITVIVDDRGRVVARDSDVNAMFGADLAAALPAVAEALRGTSSVTVWESSADGRVLQAALAPIRAEDGRVLGVLVVGYDLSNGLARGESELSGRDVAFVWGDRVYSSSLDGAGPQMLAAHLFGEGRASLDAARGRGSVSDPFLVAIGDSEYTAVVGPFAGASRVGLVILGNRTAQVAKAAPVAYILVFTIVGALAVIAYGFFIGSSILAPITRMEEGILQVINGNTSARLDVQGSDFGGLAYRINQLLNMMTNTEEVDETGAVAGRSGAEWNDAPREAASDASASPSSSGGEEDVDPAVAAALAAEPEDSYFARVYAEYVAAKQAVGENVSNIPQDKFVQRLKANEQALVKKHGCRMVRFQVQTRGTQVNLKPVIIR